MGRSTSETRLLRPHISTITLWFPERPLRPRLACGPPLLSPVLCGMRSRRCGIGEETAGAVTRPPPLVQRFPPLHRRLLVEIRETLPLTNGVGGRTITQPPAPTSPINAGGIPRSLIANIPRLPLEIEGSTRSLLGTPPTSYITPPSFRPPLAGAVPHVVVEKAPLPVAIMIGESTHLRG